MLRLFLAAALIGGQPAVADEKTVFDIAAQPLGAALLAYTQTTGAEVFADDALIMGRQSQPVQGSFSPEVALRRLLAGSGLTIRRAANDAFTLVAGPVGEPPPDWRPNWSSDTARVRFFASLQGVVKRVLCAHPNISPGFYRAAVALWIDPAGRVIRARLLSSKMDGSVGRTIFDGMRGLSIGHPPPAGLAQPITFVILPRLPDQTGDCTSQTQGGG